MVKHSKGCISCKNPATSSSLGGHATIESISLTDDDGVVINDNGTMKQCFASDLKDYATSNITSLGTLTELNIDGELTLGGDLVTATAADLNCLTSNANIPEAVQLTGDDGVVIHEVSSGMKQCRASDIKSYVLSGSTNLSDLHVQGNAEIDGNLSTEKLTIDGTVVSATADELNTLIGNNSNIATNYLSLIDSNEQHVEGDVSFQKSLDLTTHGNAQQGLKLNGTLVTASAEQLNSLNTFNGNVQEQFASTSDELDQRLHKAVDDQQHVQGPVEFDNDVTITGNLSVASTSLKINQHLVTATAQEINHLQGIQADITNLLSNKRGIGQTIDQIDQPVGTSFAGSGIPGQMLFDTSGNLYLLVSVSGGGYNWFKTTLSPIT